jgi:hypothetical protein
MTSSLTNLKGEWLLLGWAGLGWEQAIPSLKHENIFHSNGHCEGLHVMRRRLPSSTDKRIPSVGGGERCVETLLEKASGVI